MTDFRGYCEITAPLQKISNPSPSSIRSVIKGEEGAIFIDGVD